MNYYVKKKQQQDITNNKNIRLRRYESHLQPSDKEYTIKVHMFSDNRWSTCFQTHTGYLACIFSSFFSSLLFATIKQHINVEDLVIEHGFRFSLSFHELHVYQSRKRLSTQALGLFDSMRNKCATTSNYLTNFYSNKTISFWLRLKKGSFFSLELL